MPDVTLSVRYNWTIHLSKWLKN